MDNIVKFKKRISVMDEKDAEIVILGAWDLAKDEIRRMFTATGLSSLADGFIDYFEPIYREYVKPVQSFSIQLNGGEDDPLFAEINRIAQRLGEDAYKHHVKMFGKIYRLELEKYTKLKLFPDD